MRLNSLKQRLKQTAFYIVYKRNKTFDSTRLDAFVSKKYDSKSNDLKRLKRLLRFCYVYGGVRYNEFFANHFENKTWKERKRLIPCCAQNNLYIQVNSVEWLDLLEDKWKCYCIFKKYYDRDLLAVPANTIREEAVLSSVVRFVEKHPFFMVKPLNSAGGKGIKMLDMTSRGKENLRELFDEYPNGFVLEERILQAEEMAVIHRHSVNTIRIQTVNYGDSIEIKWPCLRMGRGESVVDNVFMGGVFVGVDVNTGKTFGLGKDALGNSYTEHPDSRIGLDGFQIPRWKELCDVLVEMASLCPTCRVVGWDMALTENGWKMVEANYGPELIYQDVSPKGFYEDFLCVRKRLHAGKFKGYRWKNQFRP